MLYQALQTVVQQFGHRPALVTGSESLTYDELWSRSTAVALELRADGVTAGDRVAILASNCIEAVIMQWAVYRCHAISVYLNDQLKPEDIGLICNDAGPVRILTHPAAIERKLPETLPCPVRRFEDFTLTLSTETLDEELPTGGDPANTIASIVYTSGSTGVPKGVCLTHRNLLSVARMAADGYAISETDSYLMVVPLHYIHGLMILVCMQTRGASIEFMNSFMFPSAVTKRIKESQVTGFSGVPYHFSALIDKGGFLETEFPHLRWVGVTGGTISPPRLAQIRENHPNLEIHISYGQTECSPRITLLDPARIDSKPTSVGAVAEGLVVEFIDDNGKPVAAGEVGELVASGDNVMFGYWNDEVATAKVIDEQGRLHTGDLAFMDGEGDIFIRGRKQAMIKSAGERIFPEELEALLNKHPRVADVAVVGVPDALYGQRVEAHLILESESGDVDDAQEVVLTEIREFCLTHVPFARAPRAFHVWPDFPLKANGKTDKQKLMAMAEKP